ncbi:hypothetical protein C8A05DRAFT_13760 [Staphylotrichum tortipilum]|uniref:Thymocyte nuclear protein 1 n=1 Tax=Staphylotrichum tortipilum TaxID=2831512 RepID=A0AAN6MQY4_9PEZI|nr:hypothetical protein C8A05DRAFT_13760 [Staphylotrichum longicolle]
MPKRKSAPAEEPEGEPARRRSVRLQKPEDATPKPGDAGARKRVKATKKEAPEPEAEEPAAAKKAAPAKSKTTKAAEDATTTNGTAAPEGEPGQRNYWLLKAEPESRLENGVDVKFSIDDLAARTEPEPWDGIRAYAARNNLRAMKKGELAFFYHSNCKEPGIVGTMEIVREHTPDLSAHNPAAPYYDPKSSPSDPKWSVVHVKFRSKFPAPVTLKQLREMGGAGGPLANMQMLKQSRLSVSRVSEGEWEAVLKVMEGK